MPYRRGDIVLVLFPDSNLRTSKRRPALVVQRDDLRSGLPQTIVALITSNIGRGEHPSRKLVRQTSEEGRQMGLHTDSVIMTDNLVTVIDGEFDKVIGQCPQMEAIDVALKHTLSL